MSLLQWPQWTYGRHCISVKDPINLVFRGNASLLDIKSVLEDPQNNWREPNLLDARSDLYLSDNSQCRKQDKHFMRGHLFDRHHVRIWNFQGSHVASAHHETWLSLAAMLKGVLGHYSDSFDDGREQVALAFDSQPGWQVVKKFDILYNSLPRQRSDGHATRISN